MGKAKSCIAGDYIVECAESGTITMYRVYDNVKGGLREAAEAVGFEYDPAWNTRQFGAKIITFVNEKIGSDDTNAGDAGEYHIEKLSSGTISIYKKYDNVKGGLREAAKAVNFEYDQNWNTRQFGSKIIDYINDQKG